MTPRERSPITSHILDISRGKAAAGVAVVLEHRQGDGHWKKVGQGVTNADGRVEELMLPGAHPVPGVYRLHFQTEAYFKAQGIATFYPFVEIAFEIRDSKEHHHVPLLLSPFGFSTYRGT